MRIRKATARTGSRAHRQCSEQREFEEDLGWRMNGRGEGETPKQRTWVTVPVASANNSFFR